MTILATSREALAVPDEVQVTVGPLDTPPEATPAGRVLEYPAAQLFVERARSVDGDTLAFSIQNKPDWAQFNTATGQLSGPMDELRMDAWSREVPVWDGSAWVDIGAFRGPEGPQGPPSVTAGSVPPCVAGAGAVCMEHVIDAIAREKQIKNWRREWKIELIERLADCVARAPCSEVGHVQRGQPGAV